MSYVLTNITSFTRTPLLVFLRGLCLVLLLASCRSSQWELVWQENFSGHGLDETVWSRTSRNGADWGRYQSPRADLLSVRDGKLILRGIRNPDRVTPDQLPGGRITATADTARFLTAGVVSAGKHAFPPRSRILVRARLHGARGAWPAIWLLPFDEASSAWPYGGEVDMMERLNSDSIAYQTVHSHYTYHLHHGDKPRQGGTGRIGRDGFNVYGAEFYADSVVLTINGRHTLTYPRLSDPDAALQGQFPFDRSWYLLMDMQLGGEWVGCVDPADLPVCMEIDWVRQYRRKR